MASRQVPAPPSHKKIPKLQTTSPSAVQGWSASNAHFVPLVNSSRPTKSPLSSPRKPISFRTSTVPTPLMNHPASHYGSLSIKSKSDGETRRQPVTRSPRSQPIPISKQDQMGQGEGLLPRSTFHEKERSGQDTLEHIDKPEMDKVLAGCHHNELNIPNPSESNSVDVDVLYAASPIRMESTTSSVAPPFPKSPTYLNMYRQQKQCGELQTVAGAETVSSFQSGKKVLSSSSGCEIGSSKTLDSLLVKNSIFPGTDDSSLEWDFTDHHCNEVCTQTSGIVPTVDRASSSILVGTSGMFPITTTVDRASSSFSLESYSKESLLENQTKPLSVMNMNIDPEQTTEHEESDGDTSCNDEKLPCQTVKVYSLTVPMENDGGDINNQNADDDGTEAMVEEEDTDDGEELVEIFYLNNTVNRGKEAIQKEIVSSAPPSRRDSVWNILEKKLAPSLSEHQRENEYSDVKEDPSCREPTQGFFPLPPTQPLCTQFTQMLESPAQVGSECCVMHSTKAENSAVHHSEHQDPPKRISTSSPPDWLIEKHVPKLVTNPSGSAIEIQPSPVPLTIDELKMNEAPGGDLENNKPAVSLQVKSSIILEQCVTSHGTKLLTSSFELSNSTAFLQGYKILVNAAAAKDRMTIHPSMGIISPHRQVMLKISTDSDQLSQEAVANYRIVVKMFRVYCDDLKKLKEYYYGLENQHPELVQTKIIENFIIWKNDNLVEMLDMLNSVSEERVRNAMKEDLHRQRELMREYGPELNIRQQLTAIKLGMIVANQNIEHVADELKNTRNCLLFMTVIGLCIIGIIEVTQYRIALNQVPLEMEEPSFCEWFTGFFPSVGEYFSPPETKSDNRNIFHVYLQ